MAPQSAALAFAQTTESATRDWRLSTESFELLLKQLHPDRDEAARRYVSLYDKLVRYFEWRGSNMSGLYADETMDRIARRIEQGATITNFQGFMFGVARRVVIEALKEREKEQKLLNHLSQSEPCHPCSHREYLMARIDASLLMIPPTGRRLLIAYYSTGDDKNMKLRRELAQREGISLNALRVRVHRLRAMLETYVKTDLDDEYRLESIATHDVDERPATISTRALYAI
jgi:DNA-directed RNA polymerase specialized sigma24 family protein